jgi:hypothetical protein
MQMKKLTYSISSLLLTGSILLGAMVSCADPKEITSSKEVISDQTESTTIPDNSETESQSFTTESSSVGNETEKTTETETGAETGAETETETEQILLDGEQGALISLSNKLANTVDTFYSNASKNGITIQNSNAVLNYNMGSATEKKTVTSLADTKGNLYLNNTMDVFVKMKNGNTYFAGDSAYSASLNIYRYGYYYYENRIEGQSFVGEVKKLDDTRVNHLNYSIYNGFKEAPKKSGGKLNYVLDGNDPWIRYEAGFSTKFN